MPSKFLTEVANYCWSNKFLGEFSFDGLYTFYSTLMINNHSFLDVFRNFFTEHAEAFEGAPPMTSGEHDLKYYNLFQIYLKLYEVRRYATLMPYLPETVY